MATCWSVAKSFHSPNPSQQCAAPSIANLSISAGWSGFSTAPEKGAACAQRLVGLLARPLGQGPRQKSLLRRRFPQLGIRLELRRYPLAQPFRLEHRTMHRVVVAHGE